VFKLLIDTCVWLDLVKDYQQQAILGALEELTRQGEVSLILPRTVVDEFARNKARVIEESGSPTRHTGLFSFSNERWFWNPFATATGKSNVAA
jgi:hypothetical protein